MAIRCRAPLCRRPATKEVKRPITGAWWSYCERHFGKLRGSTIWRAGWEDLAWRELEGSDRSRPTLGSANGSSSASL